MSSGNPKAGEFIIPVFPEMGTLALNHEEEWKEFFEKQNNTSTNTTNTKRSNPHVRVESNGMYKYTAIDENKYNGKYITGKVADDIKREMFNYFGNDVSKSIDLKESKVQKEGDVVMPSARIVLNASNTIQIDTTNLFKVSACQKYGIKSVTFCLPNEDKTRGLRCQIIDGVRIYEVCNGSYELILGWFAGSKECKVKILMNGDGSLQILEQNGVTEEELKENKEVKVGRQYEAKFLHEALVVDSTTKEIPSTMSSGNPNAAWELLIPFFAEIGNSASNDEEA